MRALLILLILANLGYLAWRLSLDESASSGEISQQRQFQQAEQALTLLSELPATRLAVMSSLAEARTARTQARQQLQQTQQEAEAIAGELAESQEGLLEEQARSAAVQQALLDSLDASVAGAGGTEVEAGDDAEAATGPATAPAWCAETGAFAEQAAAAAFARDLEGLGARATIEQREEAVSSTWWVHMPAFATEAEAQAMLRELQSRNIDSYYMRSGEMAGGISLGVYSREESAGIAQRQLAGQGYTTSIREVFRMEERPYIRLELPDGSLRESPEWLAFLAATGPVELTEFTCDPIASKNQFP